LRGPEAAVETCHWARTYQRTGSISKQLKALTTGKAQAVNAGRQRVVGLQFDVIGNLDADVSFEPDYFEFLMTRFAENPKLGVAGTAFLEGNLSYNYELVGIERVPGMIQMFRRQC